MIASAIERVGIPVVQITAVPAIGKWIGAPRVLRGEGITNPLGNNRLTREQEKRLRREYLLRALELLQTDVKHKQSFTLTGLEET